MPKTDPFFLSLTANADVVEADAHGVKVLLNPDGSYLKVFRRKRLLSSAMWNPYAQRFADNADLLRKRGIPCPEVLRVYSFPILNVHVVHYSPLVGQTLRQAIRDSADDDALHALRVKLGRFVAELHETGVYFRSIHLGNVVLGDDGRLGLIDIADMKVIRKPLSRLRRKRNLVHLLRYKEDTAWLLADGGVAFAEAYTSNGAQSLLSPEICAHLMTTAQGQH